MARTQEQKRGGMRKIGRWERKPSNQRYKTEHRRFHNKVKRVRQSNGEEAAQEYTRAYWRR